MKSKIILDLCGGTGAWSKPYQENGYDVRLITLPYYDVLTYQPPPKVYGILAAPPCTDFAGSGARWWGMKDGNTALLQVGGLHIVKACLDIINQCNPVFWALENPVGRLRRYLGKPKMYFNPCDFGDPYTKLTCLWGNFNIPTKKPAMAFKYCSQGSFLQKLGGKSDKTKELRSITPPGFAWAFYKANQ